MKVRIAQHWIEYDFKTNWSARSIANKMALRSAAELNKNKLAARKKKSAYVSISHTKTAGGFAVATRPVGFDLEPSTRKLSLRALRRLGTEEEIQQCPTPISLWVMKEAAWKSLKGPHQPKTITKIKIHDVKKNKSNSHFLFSFKTSTIHGLGTRGNGVVVFKGRLILGIALN